LQIQPNFSFDFFFPLRPVEPPIFSKNYRSFEADGKDTTSIFTIKVFLQRTSRSFSSFLYAVSKRVAKIGPYALLPNNFWGFLLTFQ
jgi:hypothetical protein